MYISINGYILFFCCVNVNSSRTALDKVQSKIAKAKETRNQVTQFSTVIKRSEVHCHKYSL